MEVIQRPLDRLVATEIVLDISKHEREQSDVTRVG